MQTFPLILENGHLFVAIAEGSFLFDTGAPTSFGKVSQVTVGGQSFNLPPSYMGYGDMGSRGFTESNHTPASLWMFSSGEI
jgi:hypothetical protein